MADYRPIKIKMWHDNWFLSLNPEERLLWVFILTNEYVHISGIYELPEALITPLTGILNPSKILKKFEEDKKVIIKNGFIFIRQYLKNQTKQINKKDNITKSIIAYLAENTHFIDWFNLRNEAPYKPLISPLVAPSESNKEESSKVVKIKDYGDKSPNNKKPMNIPIIELDNDGERIVAPPQPKKYGKKKLYAKIAVHYMTLTGKTGNALRHFPAIKEIYELCKQSFPTCTEEYAEQEIIDRINITNEHFKKLNCDDWGLGKVAENWDKIRLNWDKISNDPRFE